MIKPVINKLFILITFFILLFAFNACQRQPGGSMYLSTEGDDFCSAELLVDGNGKGHLQEMRKEGTCHGAFIHFPLKEGAHTISIVALNGKKVEVEAYIERGEYYVSYSSVKNVLEWNNDKYDLVPGETIKVP